LYARDNPQFGPRNSRISPVSTFPTTITAEFFYPGATNDQNTPFFDPLTFIPNLTSQVYVDPATVTARNISLNPAVPLNIQTQMVANYAGSSLIAPLDTSTGNANWIYSPINVGNPNAPAGSSFVFNVVNEGSWLILDSDLAETNSNIDGRYILLNDVNNNKIVKQGLGILVFESNNGYTGSTSIEQGLLIISDNDGLGSALTNSNVDVSGVHRIGLGIYLMDLKILFHLGPFCQLNQIMEALPTIWSSGTNPQNLESWELCLLSPIIQ
jgi:autotransporter-associated beta strand protein